MCWRFSHVFIASSIIKFLNFIFIIWQASSWIWLNLFIRIFFIFEPYIFTTTSTFWCTFVWSYYLSTYISSVTILNFIIIMVTIILIAYILFTVCVPIFLSIWTFFYTIISIIYKVSINLKFLFNIYALIIISTNIFIIIIYIIHCRCGTSSLTLILINNFIFIVSI